MLSKNSNVWIFLIVVVFLIMFVLITIRIPLISSIMNDIKGSLNENGQIVIMERMAKKSGQRHGDCGHLKLVEEEFLFEMNKYGFKSIKKVLPDKKTNLTFYTFTIN